MTVILRQHHIGEPVRTCSATCHAAKKDECACICGGKYHGIARTGARPKSVEEADLLARVKAVNKLLAEGNTVGETMILVGEATEK